MFIDGKLLTTFLELLLFFGILGWAVDAWLRSRTVFLYPVYGIIIFGATFVPLTYLLSRFSLAALWSVATLIVAAGVVGTLRHHARYRPSFHFHPRALLISLFALGLVIINIVQASKYGIPGGIDSAIHSTIIQGVVAKSTTLPGTYPLGMHITVFGLEEFFSAQQELVFLSFYLILMLSAMACVAYLADRMLRHSLAGYLALAVGCIDVSLYNNYLNGSGTHIVGIAFSLFLLVAAAIVQEQRRWFRVVGLTAGLVIIWYFHYPTLFFSLPLLWAWRLSTQKNRHWEYIVAFCISLIISIPVQLKLFHDPSYAKLIVPGVIAILAVEGALYFGAKIVHRFIWHRLTLFVLAASGAWMFYHYSTAFLFLPTWYGVMLIRLALIGLLAAVARRNSFGVMSVLGFFMLSLVYAALQQPVLASQSRVMTELFYYFGFTCVLVLLGTNGADAIILFLHSRRWRQLVVGIVTIYAILLVGSRAFDQPFVRTMLANDRPISRYESSRGFGIFYTRNDAALASWVKKHIPSSAIIANPGGLYNTWAALANHPTLWASYNVPTVVDSEQYISSIHHLLRNEPGADIDALLRRGIEYILVPENYSVAIYNSRVKLLQQIGQSRLYQLLPNSVENWSTIRMGDPTSADGITVTTSGKYSCRYCGDPFYFTDREVLTALTLPPDGSIEVSYSAAQSDTVSLYVDSPSSGLELQWGAAGWQKVTGEKNQRPSGSSARSSSSVLLRNTSTSAAQIFALGIRSE